MSFVIATDTTANLPTKFLRENNIPILPLAYIINGKAETCEIQDEFDGKAFYDKIRKGASVSTTQINPQAFTDLFRKISEESKDILFISISSGVSGSANSAKIAAAELMEEMPGLRIEIIDTLTASLGEGLVVVKAVECRKAGMSFEDTVALMHEHISKMRSFFTVDDLKHLKRTGRLSNVAATVGTVLHIKPILIGDNDGKIISIAKVHGRKRSLETLAAKYDALAVEPEKQTIGIAHADCLDEAKHLIALLNRNRPPKDVLLVCYEPVTGAHVGPGTIALFFTGEKRF